MVHVIQLALGAFMSILGAKSRTKSLEAHERHQHFEEIESTKIGNGERHRNEGNARIYKVSAMRPGSEMLIEKVRISWYFERPEAECHIADNACCINYADRWSLEQVHPVSKSQCPYCSTSDYKCEDTLELYSGVARACLPITGILTQVTSKANISWIPAAIHNSGWMYDCQVCHGSGDDILILDPFDFEEAYSQIASHYYIENDMINHTDGVMRALAKMKTESKEDLFLAVKLARQKLSKYYADVTKTTSMLLCSVPILDPYRQLRSFRKLHTGMGINSECETSYTTQLQEAFLKNLENEYFAKHWRVPVNKLKTVSRCNLVPSATASGSYQSCCDPYDLSSNDRNT